MAKRRRLAQQRVMYDSGEYEWPGGFAVAKLDYDRAFCHRQKSRLRSRVTGARRKARYVRQQMRFLLHHRATQRSAGWI